MTTKSIQTDIFLKTYKRWNSTNVHELERKGRKEKLSNEK